MKAKKIPLIEPQVDDFCFLLAQIIARLQKVQGIPEEGAIGSVSNEVDWFAPTSQPAGKMQGKEAQA